jgi:hypothetical protein
MLLVLVLTFKKNICKHMMGIAILEGKYHVPDQAKDIPVNEKRKRGRPAKARKALIVQ